MKNKEFQKLLRKNKSNSGFSLTELLVGLIMSIFVIGALGFGLMQVLQLTQKGNSETAARNESSRALDFISDEMRRAQAIEVDMSDDHIIKNVAKNYSKPSGGTIRLALQIPGVDQRIIYSVAPPKSSSPWKGPNVIYRWGPALTADGSYVTDPDSDQRIDNPSGWKNEALVDGISDEDQTASCDGSDVTYKGFFACVVDDDGDEILDASGNPIKENAVDTNGDGEITFADDPEDLNGDGEYNFGERLTDTNGDGVITIADSALDINRDGVINAEDGADTDGLAITAQLYFTGETKKTSISTSTYSADTKTVARARTAPDNNASAYDNTATVRERINTQFACTDTVVWKMRTDFGDSISNPSNLDKWEYDPNNSNETQPQPIPIEGDTLVISSVPMGLGKDTKCLNERANNGREDDQAVPRDFSGNKELTDEDWYGDSDKDDVVAVSHTINLNDPRTFNGDHVDCTGSPCPGSAGGKVYTKEDGVAATVNEYVLVLKQGTVLSDLNGYDMNNNKDLTDQGDQKSLGELLYEADYATKVSDSVYKVDKLDNDQRIIAFEVGKSEVSNRNAPGVDFQDNVFILQSDAFAQKYKTYEDNFNNSNSYTPPTYNVPY